MKRSARLDSASGLRPASAFVVIAGVLTLVGIWVGRASLQGGGSRSPWTRTEADPKPEYTVLDCEGRPLALFVQRLDLVMSPNAMWQSHLISQNFRRAPCSQSLSTKQLSLSYLAWSMRTRRCMTVHPQRPKRC